MQLLSEQTTTTYIDIALSRQIMMKGFCLLSVSLRIMHKKSGVSGTRQKNESNLGSLYILQNSGEKCIENRVLLLFCCRPNAKRVESFLYKMGLGNAAIKKFPMLTGRP